MKNRCKISKIISHMQKNHHIFTFFFKNICIYQKKAVLLHPLLKKSIRVLSSSGLGQRPLTP